MAQKSEWIGALCTRAAFGKRAEAFPEDDMHYVK